MIHNFTMTQEEARQVCRAVAESAVGKALNIGLSADHMGDSKTGSPDEREHWAPNVLCYGPKDEMIKTKAVAEIASEVLGRDVSVNEISVRQKGVLPPAPDTRFR